MKHDALPGDLVEEPMIAARQAAIALGLPYFWFADRTQRARYRIPHYRLVGLIRFRVSELTVWLQSEGVRRPRVSSREGTV